MSDNEPRRSSGAACTPLNVFTSTFSAAANTVTTTSPVGRQIVETVDSRDRLTQRVVPGISAALGLHYDTIGRVDQITHGTRTFQTNYNTTTGWIDSTTDMLGRTTTYVTRDNAGRPTSETLPGARTLGLGWDLSGNLSSVTPPGRPTHSLGYNVSPPRAA